MEKLIKFFIIYILFWNYFLFSSKSAKATNLELGEHIFQLNCNVCHLSGKNIIIPEKNLKLETLKLNGMDKIDAIVYQVINGKNGMPAFGGRLTDEEILQVSSYVLENHFRIKED